MWKGVAGLDKGFQQSNGANHESSQKVSKGQKMILAAVFVILIIVTIGSFMMPRLMNGIHASELESIVYTDFDSEKVAFFNFSKRDQEIKDKEAVSVLFAQPSNNNYHTVVNELNQKDFEAQMNRPIYYYPLVYDVKESSELYQFASEEITFIFFENGKEKNRFTYEEVISSGTQLITAINRLPVQGLVNNEVMGPERP